MGWRGHRRLFVWIAVALLASVCCAEDVPTVEPASPISWTASEAEPAVAEDAALRACAAFLGVEPTHKHDLQLVKLTDREHPVFRVRERSAWLARFERVEVVRPESVGGGKITVPLTVCIDAADASFLCAFTDSRPRWIRTMTGVATSPESVLASIKRAEWGLKPVAGPPRYTVPDVLGRSWSSLGMAPGGGGQTVVRLADCRTRFPATPIHRVDGTVEDVPLRPVHRTWLLAVMGGPKMSLRRGAYATRQYWLIADGTGKCGPGFLKP